MKNIDELIFYHLPVYLELNLKKRVCPAKDFYSYHLPEFMAKIFGVAFGAYCKGLVANAQKLDKFGADLGKKSVMGKEIRVPYSDVVSYYGFIKPGATPDETRDGKKYYYLYMWVPVAAPEIGIRMVSPIPEGMKPNYLSLEMLWKC